MGFWETAALLSVGALFLYLLSTVDSSANDDDDDPMGYA